MLNSYINGNDIPRHSKSPLAYDSRANVDLGSGPIWPSGHTFTKPKLVTERGVFVSRNRGTRSRLHHAVGAAVDPKVRTGFGRLQAHLLRLGIPVTCQLGPPRMADIKVDRRLQCLPLQLEPTVPTTKGVCIAGCLGRVRASCCQATVTFDIANKMPAAGGFFTWVAGGCVSRIISRALFAASPLWIFRFCSSFSAFLFSPPGCIAGDPSPGQCACAQRFVPFRLELKIPRKHYDLWVTLS